MTQKQFFIARIIIGILVAIIVAGAVSINNFYLAISGVLIGMLFLYLVRVKFSKVVVDERIVSVSGKASRMTYVIVTLLLAILSMFLIFSGKKNNDIAVESIGVILSYVTILNIAVYAVSFRFFNKMYGGDKK